MSALDDLDQVLERYHPALGEVVKGDPEPLKMLYSHREEVSLANPFFPPVSGWEMAARNMERAASRYGDGEIVGFEPVAKYVTSELACVVEVEHYRAKVGGREVSLPWPFASRASSGPKRAPGRWCIGTRTP
jgi:hypothetical protein